MLNEIEFLLDGTDGSQFLIETGDDRWWDGQLHTAESVSFARGLKRRQKVRELYDEAIRQSAVVIITIGLIEAWWDEEKQLYLNETVPLALVQRHPDRFFFEVLSIEKVVTAIRRLIEQLRAIIRRIIFCLPFPRCPSCAHSTERTRSSRTDIASPRCASQPRSSPANIAGWIIIPPMKA